MPVIHFEPVPRSIRVSDLLALLQKVGGLDRQRVGRIELRGGSATVEVPEGWQFRLARVLELEGAAQARQVAERARRLSPVDAERSGTTLIDLVLVDEDSGLGGRRLWSLGKRNRAPLPWTTLDVGSPVVLSGEAKRPGEPLRGVVFRRDESTIGVALAESKKGVRSILPERPEERCAQNAPDPFSRSPVVGSRCCAATELCWPAITANCRRRSSAPRPSPRDWGSVCSSGCWPISRCEGTACSTCPACERRR